MARADKAAFEFAPTQKRVYALPSQPLDAALNAFGTLNGVQIYYENAVTAGRLSAPVEGDFDAETALRMLLQGSGLAVRAITPGSLSIVEDRPHVLYRPYYDTLEAALATTLCASTVSRQGGYRVVLQYWLDERGTISRIKIVSPREDIARAIGHALKDAAFPPPPPNMPGPVTTVIEASSDFADTICNSRP